MNAIPTLRDGVTVLRPIRVRDARALERELIASRTWLRPWEATSPVAPMSWDTKGSIRGLLAAARGGQGLPFIIETEGRLAGQLNVSGMSYGSLSSATIGYWVGEGFAGRGLTPTAVALATDHIFFTVGLHRMEICIRPENVASLRVVEKLGFRYEGLRRPLHPHTNGDWTQNHFCFAAPPRGSTRIGCCTRLDASRAVPEAQRPTCRRVEPSDRGPSGAPPAVRPAARPAYNAPRIPGRPAKAPRVVTKSGRSVENVWRRHKRFESRAQPPHLWLLYPGNPMWLAVGS